MKTYQAGIDVGSTTVKLVVLDENGQMIFGQYQRHLSHTQRALSDLLKQARAALGECALELRATGSGAINLAKALGIPFVQEVVAVAQALERVAPQVDVAIELGGEDAKIIYFKGGLEERMNTPVGLLSGGQRQALTLLMATMVTPELLLLDEHTAALDPVTADKVLALTRSIVSERSISCLMITHNMHQALELGSRTLMMDAGRIVLDVSDAQRADMTVQGLIDAFAAQAGTAFDNDRVLLSTAEGTEA